MDPFKHVNILPQFFLFLNYRIFFMNFFMKKLATIPGIT